MITARIPSYSLELTRRCNNDCLYCYNVWKKDPSYAPGESDTGSVKAIVDKLIAETGPRFFTLSGGEPLLRDDLPEIVTYLGGMGYSVLVITNGALLEDESLARTLIRSGVSLFEITLLSHRPEVHNHLAGNDVWHKVVKGIRNVRSNGGSVALTFIATEVNIPDYEETLKLSISLGADRLVFNRVNLAGEAARHIEELMPTVEDLLYALAVANRYGAKYGYLVNSTIPIQPCILNLHPSAFPYVSINACSIGTENASYVIDPSGQVRPCSLSATVLGDFRRSSMAEILASETLRSYAESVPAICGACLHAPSCRGGCKAAAESCYGSSAREDPFLRLTLSLRRQQTLFPTRLLR